MTLYIRYRLIKTERRLTFDIIEQETTWRGKTDDDYLIFRASNGVEVISRSRMDVQTDRLWLIGCSPNERSGSMVFSSNEKRDRMFDMFNDALVEWATHVAELRGYEQNIGVLKNDDAEQFTIYGPK